MGCRIAKAEVVGDQPQPGRRVELQLSSSEFCQQSDDDMPNNSTGRSAEHYKTRLERQMCLARETPETDFTLSDCGLKTVPSGVFILCRVLRKEVLNLQSNRLRSLESGGALSDLSLLTTLDLRRNLFKRLPEELDQLENLRSLFVSHNLLDRLPASLFRLRQLEQLDLAHNKLRTIVTIKCMPNLRLLDVSANPDLAELPMELSTCTALVELICTTETIRSPSPSVISSGTHTILKYLMGDSLEEVDGTEEEVVDNKRVREVRTNDNGNEQRTAPTENCRTHITNDILNEERANNAAAEFEMQRLQQQRRKQLLQNLIQQQNENDALVSKVQSDRDTERSKLIDDIVRAEESSSLAVDKLLTLRIEPDAALLELELTEQSAILEQLRIQHSELRKHEVLNAMSDLLAGERRHIDEYQQRRDETTRDILRAETDANERLDRIVWDKDRDRTDVVGRIMQDEHLQMAAVGTLIEQNDARSWALMEQVRLVEAQLLRMTRIELHRKQLSVDNQLTELGEQRMNLTCMLLDLMDQQEKRKNQLLDTLHDMENQKRNQEDFWLLQYQKLIDSRPDDHTSQAASLDPKLGYQLLVHEVIHCLPFLAKMLQPKHLDFHDITDTALREGGVSNPSDRTNILRAIEDYLLNEHIDNRPPSAPPEECCAAPTAPNVPLSSESAPTDREDVDLLAECVVCMEQSCKVIFLPCGHLCCCLDCHDALLLCPMCRSEIERRIKVIQT